MAYNPAHYQANKEKYAEKSKQWREANRERHKANSKKYYEANKAKHMAYSTAYNRLKKTGVSPEAYESMLEKQQGLCAICRLTCTRALAADHNHTTGVFRGLLCNNCNRGLGHFKDNIENLEAALSYLKGTNDF